MSGGFEDRVRHWMREEGKVDPRALAIIGDGVAFLPPRNRRSRLPLLVAATLGALAVALLTIPRLGSIDAPGAARPPDPAAFAGDSRLERVPGPVRRCGACLRDAAIG
jgi:hypothetical protein